MNNNEEKLIQFIDAQINEINGFKDTAPGYFNGALRAFECIKNYINSKKHLGKINTDCILPAYNPDNTEKDNE